jgi:uncharacterized protein
MATKKTKSKKTAAKVMNPVVHFELPTADRKRSADFYAKAFGWKMQMLGPKMHDYVLATTSPTDKTGRPTEPGVINGGLYMKKGMPLEHPSLVIGVGDIKAAMKKVTKAGGRLLGEPVEIPGIGMYVSFLDIDKNRLSLMEPFMPE